MPSAIEFWDEIPFLFNFWAMAMWNAFRNGFCQGKERYAFCLSLQIADCFERVSEALPRLCRY
jgi:hypothetical protein